MINKILLLEDDPLQRYQLKEEVEKYGEIIDVNTIQKATEAIQKYQFDIALLDIEIEGEEKSGIDIGELLFEKSPKTAIIYISAFIEKQGRLKLLSTQPRVILNKPYTQHEVCANIELALSQVVGPIFECKYANFHKGRIEIKFTNNKGNQDVRRVFHKDMAFIKAANNDCIIFMKDAFSTISEKNGAGFKIPGMRIKDLIKLLPSEYFTQVHRSFIVNLTYISQYIKGNLELTYEDEKTRIPIGEKYEGFFQDKYHNHLIKRNAY